MAKRSLILFVFDNVEVLDLAGPFEVFSVADELGGHTLFDIRTVSPSGGAVTAKNGLSLNSDHAISDISGADILIVPGGQGTRTLLDRQDVMTWIRKIAEKAEMVLSVCTGSMLLGKAGLLKGLRATTHHSVVDEFEAMELGTEVVRSVRFIDNGKIITSAGISAGIDMSLYVLERLFGGETADRTAAYMEYRKG